VAVDDHDLIFTGDGGYGAERAAPQPVTTRTLAPAGRIGAASPHVYGAAAAIVTAAGRSALVVVREQHPCDVSEHEEQHEHGDRIHEHVLVLPPATFFDAVR
jgi:hypothetical protein